MPKVSYKTDDEKRSRSIQIRTTPEQYQKIEKIAEQNGITKSKVIDIMFKEYLKNVQL